MAKKAKQTATASSIPPIPARFKQLGKGNFPPVFKFEKVGDVLEGTCQQIKSVPRKKVRKGESPEMRIMYIVRKDSGGEVVGLWESKALEDLFNTAKAGGSVWIRYDGDVDVGQPKPMHGYTTAYDTKGEKR